MGNIRTKKAYPIAVSDEPIYPNMSGYRMACCDCGLVHNIVFEIVKLADPDSPLTDPDKDEVIERNDLKVRIRVTRNNRATGQMRRKRTK